MPKPFSHIEQGPEIGSPQFNRVLGWVALAGVVVGLGGPFAFRAVDGEISKIADSGSGVTQAHADQAYIHDHIAPAVQAELRADGIVLTPGGQLPPPVAGK